MLLWRRGKLAPVSDSNIIITGRLSFWGNYFRPTPVSLWRSDLEPKGVSDHCYTRSDDLLAIGATGSMGGGGLIAPLSSMEERTQGFSIGGEGYLHIHDVPQFGLA